MAINPNIWNPNLNISVKTEDSGDSTIQAVAVSPARIEPGTIGSAASNPSASHDIKPSEVVLTIENPIKGVVEFYGPAVEDELEGLRYLGTRSITQWRGISIHLGKTREIVNRTRFGSAKQIRISEWQELQQSEEALDSSQLAAKPKPKPIKNFITPSMKSSMVEVESLEMDNFVEIFEKILARERKYKENRLLQELADNDQAKELYSPTLIKDT